MEKKMESTIFFQVEGFGLAGAPWECGEGNMP